MKAIKTDDFGLSDSGSERSAERKAIKRIALDKSDKHSILRTTILKYKIMRIRAKISY